MLYSFKFKLDRKNLYKLVFLIAFNCFYQIALGQDSTNSHKQQEWLRQYSYYDLELSQNQIAQLDSIENIYSKRAELLIKNLGEASVRKKLRNLDKELEDAKKRVMTKKQYKEYKSRFKPLPTDTLKG